MGRIMGSRFSLFLYPTSLYSLLLLFPHNSSSSPFNFKPDFWVNCLLLLFITCRNGNLRWNKFRLTENLKPSHKSLPNQRDAQLSKADSHYNAKRAPYSIRMSKGRVSQYPCLHLSCITPINFNKSYNQTNLSLKKNIY